MRCLLCTAITWFLLLQKRERESSNRSTMLFLNQNLFLFLVERKFCIKQEQQQPARCNDFEGLFLFEEISLSFASLTLFLAEMFITKIVVKVLLCISNVQTLLYQHLAFIYLFDSLALRINSETPHDSDFLFFIFNLNLEINFSLALSEWKISNATQRISR